ncbi:MAG: hypothetical protein WCI73_20890 [Phycisphaerae bacterium]
MNGSRKTNQRTRYGCLMLILLFAIWAAVKAYAYVPGLNSDSDGGGAGIMCFGLFLLAILYGVIGVEWLINKMKQEPKPPEDKLNS